MKPSAACRRPSKWWKPATPATTSRKAVPPSWKSASRCLPGPELLEYVSRAQRSTKWCVADPGPPHILTIKMPKPHGPRISSAARSGALHPGNEDREIFKALRNLLHHLGVETECPCGIAAEDIALRLLVEERQVINHARQVEVPVRVI